MSNDTKRFWMHFPVGMLGAFLISFSPVLGVLFTIYFMFYEAMNDWRKVDQSYKDVVGAVWGFGIMSVLILAWRLF